MRSLLRRQPFISRPPALNRLQKLTFTQQAFATPEDFSLSTLRTLQLENGEKVNPTFSENEMNRRHHRMQDFLATNNVDFALFTSYQNMAHFL